jgi:hypothetical protein
MKMSAEAESDPSLVTGQQPTTTEQPTTQKTAEQQAADKTVADKAAADKVIADKAAADKAAAAVPLTVKDIKLPEGVEVDQPSMDSFISVMNDAALTPQARAQQLIDLQTNLMKQASEKGSELWNKTQEDWQKQTLADPEIGGAKWPEASAGISRLLTEFAPKGKEAEFRQAWGLTGAGNHPLIVKFLANVSKKLTVEGRPVSGQPGAQPKTHAEILFPDQGRK